MDNDLTPAERSLRARIAAHSRWAQAGAVERAAAAQALADGRWRKYLERVDPDGTLPEQERIQRGENLRRADMARLALAAAARRHKRNANA